MSAESWGGFADALRQECAELARVEDISLALTSALIERNASRIGSVNEQLEAARVAHQAMQAKRHAMQRRGFGELPLTKVIDYAPRAVAMKLRGYSSQLAYRAISIGITTRNNKSLILAGMDRLLKVVTLLQRTASDQPRTYRRRGVVPPPDNSVLVSRKA
jgi:hypothetical protein